MLPTRIVHMPSFEYSCVFLIQIDVAYFYNSNSTAKQQAKTLYLVKISYSIYYIIVQYLYFVCTLLENLKAYNETSNETCTNQKFWLLPNTCLIELLIDRRRGVFFIRSI